MIKIFLAVGAIMFLHAVVYQTLTGDAMNWLFLIAGLLLLGKLYKGIGT